MHIRVIFILIFVSSLYGAHLSGYNSEQFGESEVTKEILPNKEAISPLVGGIVPVIIKLLALALTVGVMSEDPFEANKSHEKRSVHDQFNFDDLPEHLIKKNQSSVSMDKQSEKNPFSAVLIIKKIISTQTFELVNINATDIPGESFSEKLDYLKKSDPNWESYNLNRLKCEFKIFDDVPGEKIPDKLDYLAGNDSF